MKKHVAFLLFALVSIALYAADPVEGFWKSIDEETGKTTAAWRIYEKDSVLYGEIVTVPNQDDATIAKDCKSSYKGFPVAGEVNKMTVVNTPFIFGLKKKSEGQWSDGNIIDPKDGKMYKCKITLRKADGKKFTKEVLEMRGEIGLGIGRSQYWERIDETEIASLRSN